MLSVKVAKKICLIARKILKNCIAPPPFLSLRSFFCLLLKSNFAFSFKAHGFKRRGYYQMNGMGNLKIHNSLSLSWLVLST